MPTVPSYDNPQVRPEGLPPVRITPSAPPEAFGGGQSLDNLDRSLSGLVRAEEGRFVDEAEDAIRTANRMRTFEKVRAFNDWEFKNIHDPQTGVINRRGRKALGVPEELKTSFDKFVEEQRKDLANDDQSVAFEAIVEERREHWMRWSKGHVAKQTEMADEAEYESSVNSAKQRAALDPATAKIEIPFIQGLTAERMKKAGLDPVVIKDAQRQQAGEVHSMIIGTLLARGRSADAKAHLDKFEGLIDQQDVPTLRHRVESANHQDTVRGDSQREASKILDGYTEMVDISGMDPLVPPRERTGPKMSPRRVEPAATLPEALQRARQITDPEVQDATVKRVKEIWDERVEQRREAKTAVFDADMKGVEVTGSTAAIPADRWLNTYDAKERAAFEQRAEQLRKREPSVTTEEGWAKLYELKDKAASPESRGAFVKENLWLYRGMWSDAEFKEMVNLQAETKKSDEKALKKLDGHSTKAEIWRSTLEGEGFFSTKGSKEEEKAQAKTRDNIRRLVDAEVRKREEKSKEEIGAAEYQEIVDQLLAKSVGEKRLYQVEQDLLAPGIDMIPEADRKIIKEELALLGFRVTEERVKATYRLRLRKDYGYPR